MVKWLKKLHKINNQITDAVTIIFKRSKKKLANEPANENVVNKSKDSNS